MGGRGQEREGRGRGLQRLQSNNLSLHLQKRFRFMLKVFSLKIKGGFQPLRKTKTHMHLTYEIYYANRCPNKNMAMFQKEFYMKILPKWSSKIPAITSKENSAIVPLAQQSQ